MMMDDLTEYSSVVAGLLKSREETVSVAESSAAGLISASLLSIPGASAYFVGGGVIYTLAARNSLLPDGGHALKGIRSASDPYASWLSQSIRDQQLQEEKIFLIDQKQKDRQNSVRLSPELEKPFFLFHMNYLGYYSH